MKNNTGFATFLAISGIAISSFALVAPANAQTAVIAALYNNNPPSIDQLDSSYSKSSENQNQVLLAINSLPEVMEIAQDLTGLPLYDRIVTMYKSTNPSDDLACLVSADGSSDGSVMCGFIDPH